jgi:hypothetical protein
MNFSDDIKVNKDVELVIVKILELHKTGIITDLTRKESIKKLHFSHVSNPTFRRATTDSRIFHLFYKSDIFNVQIQEKIETALNRVNGNIYVCSKDTGISVGAIKTYKRWLSQDKTLTDTQRDIFLQFYESYMYNEMTKEQFAQRIFGDLRQDQNTQLIDLYMQTQGMISRMHFNKCRGDAHARNILFNVTPNELNTIYQKQKGKSAVSSINIRSFYRSFHKGDENVYSIDRIDSSKAYDAENIQLMTKKENIMKGVLSNNQFLQNAIEIAKAQYLLRSSKLELVLTELDELLASIKLDGSLPIATNIDFKFDIDNSPFCY